MKRFLVILLAFVLLLGVIIPVSLAWLNDSSLFQVSMNSYLHKSYFESGDGTTAAQYPGTGSQEGYAYEIKYPVQLYYFAWLQYLGYFNIPDSNTGTIKQVYFFLSSDLDMTGWILPPVGTIDFPFVGNFDGNGHTISNLTTQNVTTTTTTTLNDIPVSTVSNRLNIVGFFGVVGSLDLEDGEVNGAVESGGSFVPTSGYAYSSSVNEVKNVTIVDANIKTDLSNSLIGIASGYVNGKMENVKVVGGTISNVSATTALTEYTTNLSDYGAVGYCTSTYRGINKVTTVKVYDPQSYTNVGGSAQGQGNNWGESIDMREMYEHLTGVYTSSNNLVEIKNSVTVTHHTDGTVTEVLSNDGTSVSLTVANYPVRVTEVDDNGDVIASYSLIEQSGTANFVYLYGEHVADTRTQAVTDVYEKNSVYIYHDNDTSHNLSFNGSAFSDAVRASATKWVMEDGSEGTKIIYTVIGNNKYYLKNNRGVLTYTSAGLTEDVPDDASEWSVSSTQISNEDYYLCFRNGTWKLLLQDRLLITDDNEEGSQHFLTVVAGNYANTMVKADAVSWVKTMASDDPDEDEFYLSTMVGLDTYYLKQSEGILVLETNPNTPSTKWKYKAATETEKSKVYTVINEDGDGYALFYDDSEDVMNWALTDFSETAAGSGSGDSFGDSINMRTIYNRLSSVWDTAASGSIRYITSETIYIDANGNEIENRRVTNYSTKTEPYITTTNSVGSYSFARYSSSDLTQKQFLYLYGDDTITLTKTVTTITYSNESAFYLSNKGYYLTCTTNSITNNISNSANATKWVLSDGVSSNGGSVSTQINGTVYYLRNNNGSLTISTTSDNTWQYSDGRLKSGSYYLIYDSGWKLTTTTRYFLITDGNGNYLNNTSGSTISRGTDEASATKWYIDDSNRIYNDSGYYLRNDNGTLSLYNGTYRASSWVVTDNQIRSGSYYLYNRNGTWALKSLTTTYVISDGNGNYLYRNGANLQNTTNIAQATKWTFSNNESGGYISEGGYYLRNNSGTLTTTTNNNQRTSWTVSGNTISNNSYKLCYSGGSWSLSLQVSGYTISYNGVYLNATSGSSIGSSSGAGTYNDANGNTIWTIGNYQNSGEIGAISTNVNGTTRYLYLTRSNNSGSLSLSNSQTTWRNWNSGNIYYRTGQGGTYYNIQLSGSTWGIMVGGQDTEGQVLSIETAENQLVGSNLEITPNVDNDTEAIFDQFDINLSVNETSTILEWQTTNITTEPSSYTTKPTYLPLSIDNEGSIDKRNTGYIVSGANLGTPGTEGYGSAGKGDIRVSYYAISNISNSTTNNLLVNTKIRTINANGDSLLTNSIISTFHKFSDDGNTEGSLTKMNGVLSGQSRVYGLHFMNAAISENNIITVANAKVNGRTFESYELPRDSIDFTLKERGYINFFAGTYFSGNDSFFSLHKIERNSDGTIDSIKEILEIYENGNNPYFYKLQDKNGTITYESWEYYPSGTVKTHTSRTSSQGVPSGYSSVFNTNWIKKQNSLTTNAVYYFEIPVDRGEYALGSVSGGTGAYLMYLDIGAAGTALKPEGNAKLEESSFNDLNALKQDAGLISYTVTGGSRTVDVNTYPTYFPLEWDSGIVADSNTGYVISGSNTDSTPPGDIRISKYSKYANGNWTSIRESLTSANDAGILDDSKVYTIIDGTQITISSYGIGKMNTMQYGAVSQSVNELLANQQYVYGLHFMEAAISASNTVTVPKAIINGVTYENYVMPQDCIDFHVATKGRIAFMAGAYFSGSNGVESFFSLHRIFRDNRNNITAIKQLSEIYSDGNKEHGYIYTYVGDSGNYYNTDGSLNGQSVPSGYVKIYDLQAIYNPTAYANIQQINSNYVYYFEIPVDAGEYALGSSDSDGAYLIYLDIASGADFAIQSTTIETTELNEYSLDYPKGVAFVDSNDSTAFDTDDKADPEKSVFISIPISNSSGDTTFDISSDSDMTVTNGTSSLSGYTVKTLPLDSSLTVNGVTITTSPSKVVVTEKVTEVALDLSGTTTTTVTTTVKTTENGVTTTVVTQTVTTEFNGSSTTTNITPAPAYDGHALVPTDYNVEPNTDAKTILEYRFSGTGLENVVSRNGELNVVTGEGTVTINGVVYNLCDVEKVDDVDAGEYEITISGTAGTYTVTVTKIDTDFVFTLNGTEFSTTGDKSVTVS